jgi:hypothetical protein
MEEVMSAVPQATDAAAKPTATLADLQRREPSEARLPRVQAGFSELAGFELLQRGAKLLAASTIVPEHYRGNLPDCVIALNMAQRIGADPLMVMQNLQIVKGKPGWSSQFLIAAFNQCGRFSSLRYKWTGERGKDNWGCRAWAVEKVTNERLEGAEVTISIAKAEQWFDRNGSKWKSMPEQMLIYRAASWFVRAYAPEIAMGLQTAEELTDVYDTDQIEPGRFEVRNVAELAARGTEVMAGPAAGPATGTEGPIAEPEKTVVDHIAHLATLNSLAEISEYADTMPEAMLKDERWTKATKERLEKINGKAPKK